MTTVVTVMTVMAVMAVASKAAPVVRRTSHGAEHGIHTCAGGRRDGRFDWTVICGMTGSGNIPRTGTRTEVLDSLRVRHIKNVATMLAHARPRSPLSALPLRFWQRPVRFLAATALKSTASARTVHSPVCILVPMSYQGRLAATRR